MLGVNARGAFEDLDDGLVAGNFKDLTGSQLAVGQRQVDDLGVFGEFDVVQDDEWTVDTNNCLVSFLQITKRLVKWLEVTISKGSNEIEFISIRKKIILWINKGHHKFPYYLGVYNEPVGS